MCNKQLSENNNTHTLKGRKLSLIYIVIRSQFFPIKVLWGVRKSGWSNNYQIYSVLLLKILRVKFLQNACNKYSPQFEKVAARPNAEQHRTHRSAYTTLTDCLMLLVSLVSLRCVATRTTSARLLTSPIHRIVIKRCKARRILRTAYPAPLIWFRHRDTNRATGNERFSREQTTDITSLFFNN